MVKAGAVKEIDFNEMEHAYEGGADGEESARKYQDCICCPCDFIVGIALLISVITQIAVIVAQFMGENPNGGTLLFVLLYCTLIRIMWSCIACCFYAMPGCAGKCRMPLRALFGLVTFIVVLLGFAVNNQAQVTGLLS
jgi:hypothetical protein